MGFRPDTASVRIREGKRPEKMYTFSNLYSWLKNYSHFDQIDGVRTNSGTISFRVLAW